MTNANMYFQQPVGYEQPDIMGGITGKRKLLTQKKKNKEMQ
jgi:hypothetical protein